MTAAVKTRPRGKKAPYLAHIDPRELIAHPSNLRTQLGDLTELRASIAATGVLQALTVVPEDGGLRIVAGHRRAAAAVEALEAGEWPDGAPLTVPCLVRPDMEGLAPAQVVAMLVENDQRADLTESERAAGYAQLELFGLDVGEIARRTGRTQKHVTAALKLTKLGEVATGAADAGKLTLEDVAELEQFEDDPKAMERILKGVESGWGVRHRVQEEKRKREDKSATETLTEELTSAGVRVLKKPKDWPWNCAAAKVEELLDADGQPLDVEVVKTLEGFGAIIEGSYGNMRAVIVCEDPDAHGYKRTKFTQYKSPAQKVAEELAKREAEERRQKLRDAGEVRSRFLVEKWGSAKGAKALLVEAMRAAVVMPSFYDRAEDDLVTALAGGDPRDGQTAGIDRLNRLLVARFVAAHEANTAVVANGRYSNRGHLVLPWLNRLIAEGYELSEAEKTWHAELVEEAAERQRAMEEEEAEALAYEAELEAEEAGDGEDGDGPAVVDAHLPEHDVEPQPTAAVDPDPCPEADLDAGEPEPAAESSE
ncbi:ParB N-terminal domain-containing protein [Micromonospora sp. ATA51]|uniref:ParB/RepB/Spo0J family partition protein n=1 Tax=Micromonospora sp. ATA51 TaxID=2806098 RepID=UPI001A4373FC|nr:ParB N-terminal domain-containing protein [Micromonospora sp. ATA51]MBM0226854.1 ParB N-terminal domain-containing protein [Micromonospora sp. ATA51]